MTNDKYDIFMYWMEDDCDVLAIFFGIKVQYWLMVRSD